VIVVRNLGRRRRRGMSAAAAACAVAACAALAACSSSNSSSSASASGANSPSAASGKTTITFESYNYGTPDLGGQGMQQLINDFEKAHPNIVVKPSGVSAADIYPDVTSQAAAGNPPDIAEIGWSKVAAALQQRDGDRGIDAEPVEAAVEADGLGGHLEEVRDISSAPFSDALFAGIHRVAFHAAGVETAVTVLEMRLAFLRSSDGSPMSQASPQAASSLISQ
jgi:hypothetical protein